MTTPTHHRDTGFWSGALAALIATAVGYGAYEAGGWFFWPDAFAQWVFAFVPGSIQAELIATFGFSAKILGFYSAILAQIAAGGLVGLLLPRARAATLAGIVLAVLGATTFAFTESASAVTLPSGLGLAAGLAVTAGLYGGLTPALRARLRAPVVESSPCPSSGTAANPEAGRPPWTRRRLLARLATVAGTAALAPWVWHNLRPEDAGPASSTADPTESLDVIAERLERGTIDFDAIPNLSPWLTPEPEFYYVSKNIQVYRTGLETWEPLKVDGLVETELELTLDDLQAMPQREQHTTLVCIDYDPTEANTRDLMSNGRWTGISLRTLLERAGLQSDVRDLKLQAADGYSESLPVDLVQDHEEILLAWALNGAELSPKHGYPLRLVIPGYYGVKNVKHIDRITAVAEDYKGYWQQRGWSDEGEIHPFAKIETPARHAQLAVGSPQIVAGVAFAGLRGVSRVEVSADGGATWQDARVEPQEGAPYSWRRWALAWRPERPGSTTLSARVIDGQGKVQTAERTGAYPDGSTGYDQIPITATSS